MDFDSIRFRGHRCFKNWAGFDIIKPINVIIGRNNTGKSHLLDLVEAICEGKFKRRGWTYQFQGVLNEPALQAVFRSDVSGGVLGGNHWEEHGRHFLNQPIGWETDESLSANNLTWAKGFEPGVPELPHLLTARLEAIHNVLKTPRHNLLGSFYRRLFADRDVHLETASTNMALGSDGHGASNIIRRYIVTSDERYPREVVQRIVLSALNEIFGKDGRFTELQVALLKSL